MKATISKAKLDYAPLARLVKGTRSPNERASVLSANTLCKSVIHRLQFPKRRPKNGRHVYQGTAAILSEADKVDAYGAGMLALAQSGYFRHGKIEYRQIIAVYRGMRRALRLDRRHAPEILLEQDALSALHEAGASVEFAEIEDMGGKKAMACHGYATPKEIGKFRADCLRVMDYSLKANRSPNKANNHKAHVDFLDYLCAIAQGETSGGKWNLNDSLNRRNRFIAYLEKGRELQKLECESIEFDSFADYLSAMVSQKGKAHSK